MLQSSSERRGLTIKLLAGLAAELLGIGADGQQTVRRVQSEGHHNRGLDRAESRLQSQLKLIVSGLILQAAESDDPEVRGLVVDAYCAASSLILRSASPAPSSAEGVAGSDMVLEVFEQVRAGNHSTSYTSRIGRQAQPLLTPPPHLLLCLPALPLRPSIRCWPLARPLPSGKTRHQPWRPVSTSRPRCGPPCPASQPTHVPSWPQTTAHQ